MDKDKLLAFYYTITLGSVTKAAEKLGCTPSWITKMLKGLMEEVGYEIFAKKGKHHILTPEGEIFFETTKNILNEYDISFKKMAKLSNRIEGEFTLSIPSFMSRLWIIDKIAPFLKKHPKISLIIKSFTEEANFKAGEVDIDIRNVPLSLLKKENVIAKPLTNYGMGFYASQIYIEERGLPKSIQDFESHTLISSTQESHFLNSYGAQPFKCTQHLTIDCIQGINYAVEHNVGIGFMLHSAAKTSQKPLIPILSEQLSQSFDLHYIYSKFLEDNLIVDDLYKSLYTILNKNLAEN